MVLKLCDELDKAADLNTYFKDTLVKHIEKVVVPDLKKKKEEVLLKDYVKEWKDYTILVHFMRKMFNYLVSHIGVYFTVGQILFEELQYAVTCHQCVGVLQREVF
jgi:hypothetical protein